MRQIGLRHNPSCFAEHQSVSTPEIPEGPSATPDTGVSAQGAVSPIACEAETSELQAPGLGFLEKSGRQPTADRVLDGQSKILGPTQLEISAAEAVQALRGATVEEGGSRGSGSASPTLLAVMEDRGTDTGERRIMCYRVEQISGEVARNDHNAHPRTPCHADRPLS